MIAGMREALRAELLDDAAKLELAKSGTPESQQQLVTAHLRLAFRLRRKHARSYVHPSDLLNVAVEGLCVAAREFDPGRGIPVTPYFYQRADHHVRHWLTADCRWTGRISQEDSAGTSTEFQGEPSTDYFTPSGTELRALVEQIHESLDARERALLVLVDEGHAPAGAIAQERLGVSEATAHRVWKGLQKRVRELLTNPQEETL